MSNDNGGDKFFFGSGGLPFITRNGQPPLYKDTDPFAKRPTDTRRVRVDVLELWNLTHWDFYQRLWGLVGSGLASVADEERKFIEDKGNWKVFIRWYVPVLMDPSELNGQKSAAVQQIFTMAEQLYGKEPKHE